MPTVDCDPEEARQQLSKAGISVEDGHTEYERWRASHGEANAVAYDDKVVVQGSRPTDLLALLRDHSGRAHVYFDGASRGNPGPAAIGWAIVNSEGIVGEGSETIGETTNNRAEYEALIRALEAADEYGFDEVDVRGDSELIVKQVHGEYDTNNPELRERRVRVRELLERFDRWSLEHVPREINDRADSLANEALDNA
ncbi:ribonuclease HI family protein [Halogeometricum borinquense]|uniref:Ribonuclease HI family protein n=1 Tax=Halogeometricum borinquense TaxID=60847 RepID=A0A6C0UHR4_9EURY|nr:ribonuclease HI [Halogeometricum borinquense]QIB73359.1 ribonuclease HI family protein [Halogeometricum borinquense]QIQ77243.1 ribonuclease HI family protein [Halogeometricum borinquense]